MFVYQAAAFGQSYCRTFQDESQVSFILYVWWDMDNSFWLTEISTETRNWQFPIPLLNPYVSVTFLCISQSSVGLANVCNLFNKFRPTPQATTLLVLQPYKA